MVVFFNFVTAPAPTARLVAANSELSRALLMAPGMSGSRETFTALQSLQDSPSYLAGPGGGPGEGGEGPAHRVEQQLRHQSGHHHHRRGRTGDVK